jgi:hypothetical protein
VYAAGFKLEPALAWAQRWLLPFTWVALDSLHETVGGCPKTYPDAIGRRSTEAGSNGRQPVSACARSEKTANRGERVMRRSCLNGQEAYQTGRRACRRDDRDPNRVSFCEDAVEATT